MQAERMAGPRMSPRHHTRGLPCSPRPRHSLPRPLHRDTGAGSSLRSLAPGPGPAQPRRCRHRYLCCRSGGRGTHRQPKLVILLHIRYHTRLLTSAVVQNIWLLSKCRAEQEWSARQRRPHSTTPATLRRTTGWASPAQLSSLTHRSGKISRYYLYPNPTQS